MSESLTTLWPFIFKQWQREQAIKVCLLCDIQVWRLDQSEEEKAAVMDELYGSHR